MAARFDLLRFRRGCCLLFRLEACDASWLIDDDVDREHGEEHLRAWARRLLVSTGMM